MANEPLAGFDLDGNQAEFVTISSLNTNVAESIIKLLKNNALSMVRLEPNITGNLFIWLRRRFLEGSGLLCRLAQFFYKNLFGV